MTTSVKTPPSAPSLAERAKALYDGGMRCNCDLDNWEPERTTGHSWVCRIHKAAIARDANGDLVCLPSPL